MMIDEVICSCGNKQSPWVPLLNKTRRWNQTPHRHKTTFMIIGLYQKHFTYCFMFLLACDYFINVSIFFRVSEFTPHRLSVSFATLTSKKRKWMKEFSSVNYFFIKNKYVIQDVTGGVTTVQHLICRNQRAHRGRLLEVRDGGADWWIRGEWTGSSYSWSGCQQA